MEYAFNKVLIPVLGGTIVQLSFADDMIPRTISVRNRVDGLQLFKDNLDLVVEEWYHAPVSYRLLTSSSGDILNFVFTVPYPKNVKLVARVGSIDTYSASLQVL